MNQVLWFSNKSDVGGECGHYKNPMVGFQSTGCQVFLGIFPLIVIFKMSAQAKLCGNLVLSLVVSCDGKGKLEPRQFTP